MDDKLVLAHYKILDTIAYLNEQGLYSTSAGIFKIVNGVIDEDTIELTNCPTFSTLLSYHNKKISRLLAFLFKRGYIFKIYDDKSNDYYYEISLTGKEELNHYFSRHKRNYKKKDKKVKREIIRL